MRICLTSDLHGSLPKIENCDILLIGGDICGPSDPQSQYNFINGPFRQWVNDIVDRNIMVFGTEGNHAILAKKEPNIFRELVHSLKWHYLENTTLPLFQKDYSIKIYGHPGSLQFGQGWAFNYTEKELEEIYSKINKDVKIIVSHGPPFGYGDLTMDGRHVGSKSLLDTIDRINPTLVCTGHIHWSYGTYQRGDTLIVNAAHMDESYRPTQPPILIEMEI